MSGTNFQLGDPVWAKMNYIPKYYKPWPGLVSLPPAGNDQPAGKKNIQCVKFFGSDDFAWIEEENMKLYEMVCTCFLV